MDTINSKIIDTTEKNTFNGLQLGFVLDTKNEDGKNDIYYPFFQHMVSDSAIGKTLIVKTENGSKKEELV